MSVANFHAMTAPIVIAIIALIVSFTSLGVSAFVALRDRGRLCVKSKFFSYEDGTASIQVEAVNKGRRPIILKRLTFEYEDGSQRNECVGDYEKGMRLGEHEAFSEQIDRMHRMLLSEDSAALTDLWFVDSIGRKHRVKGTKKNLRLFFKHNAANQY
jgi:hypothetical protein